MWGRKEEMRRIASGPLLRVRETKENRAGELGLGSLEQQLHRQRDQRNSVFSGIRCFLSRLGVTSRDGQGSEGVSIILDPRPLLQYLESESFTSVLREQNGYCSSSLANCFLQSEVLPPRGKKEALIRSGKPQNLDNSQGLSPKLHKSSKQLLGQEEGRLPGSESWAGS